MHKKFSENPT